MIAELNECVKCSKICAAICLLKETNDDLTNKLVSIILNRNCKCNFDFIELICRLTSAAAKKLLIKIGFKQTDKIKNKHVMNAIKRNNVQQVEYLVSIFPLRLNFISEEETPLTYLFKELEEGMNIEPMIEYLISENAAIPTILTPGLINMFWYMFNNETCLRKYMNNYVGKFPVVSTIENKSYLFATYCQSLKTVNAKNRTFLNCAFKSIMGDENLSAAIVNLV